MKYLTLFLIIMLSFTFPLFAKDVDDHGMQNNQSYEQNETGHSRQLPSQATASHVYMKNSKAVFDRDNPGQEGMQEHASSVLMTKASTNLKAKSDEAYPDDDLVYDGDHDFPKGSTTQMTNAGSNLKTKRIVKPDEAYPDDDLVYDGDHDFPRGSTMQMTKTGTTLKANHKAKPDEAYPDDDLQWDGDYDFPQG